jgi:molecular chaperone DnaK (HSP70)
MDQRVQEVVITVPAHFNEKQKQEIVTAGSRAKFEQVFLLEEPVAAALAYYRNDNPVSVRCLTYDLGGGTFEAAVLQKAAGGDFGILASAWSEQVSGCNFDERLAGWLFDQLKQQYDQLDHIHRESPEWNILLVLAEKAKIALSLQTSFRLYEENSGILDKKGKPLKIDVIISRETFEDLITDDIEETIGLCHHVLAKAQISLNTLDDIVMVGGSVHIPYVRQRVEEEFRGRVRYDQRPELLVVMGAALEARRYQIRQVF